MIFAIGLPGQPVRQYVIVADEEQGMMQMFNNETIVEVEALPAKTELKAFAANGMSLVVL